MATASVLGVFAHVDTTLQAIRDLRAKGFGDLTVYTPVPVEEIEEEVERVRPVSAVRFFTLVGGLTGTATGFFLTIWTSLKWELLTGGKAVVSIPPFVIIAFELTILFGGLLTALGLFAVGRLPSLRSGPGYSARFSAEDFGLVVGCAERDVPEIEALLRAAHAKEVSLVAA